MYAIVDIAGQQFKVEKGKKIFVHRLEEKEGNKVDFDRVLLIDNDGKILVGEPHIKGAYIEGKVLEHTKGDKVIVFKKKRRKGYKVKKGHRQQYSQIEIISINEKGYVKKEAKTEAGKEEKPKAAEKPAAKKTTKAKETTAASKKETEKKPAAKKTTSAKKTDTAKPKTDKKGDAGKKDDKK
ncbi:MAG: 50S ribosomal protein L21 [Bacteroidota bacterium]|nr:50S ribosomal protein L21 [Bacteroidota bacterium]